MPETVTLDREAVIDLLIEAHAVCDVHEALAGSDSPRIIRGLEAATGRIYREVCGDSLDDENRETADIFLDAADARAREIVSWLSKPREGVDH